MFVNFSCDMGNIMPKYKVQQARRVADHVIRLPTAPEFTSRNFLFELGQLMWSDKTSWKYALLLWAMLETDYNNLTSWDPDERLWSMFKNEFNFTTFTFGQFVWWIGANNNTI